ncbi:MAG: SpoIID/LytB domain-containing protein [Deltaproteobacteria bacterium]|nr:SpoIID/LytB domain-containing protein [Deltaproteobacteria bacterium]
MITARKGLFPSIALSLLCLAGCAPGLGGKIRVRVLSAAPELNVKGSATALPVDIKKTGPGRVIVNGREAGLPMRLNPDGGVVYLNNRPYKGAIEIQDGRGGLAAINELPLETYLAGLINNEISSRWAEDAVRAQAVIARTYALYQRERRINEPFHIDGSVMGQVYTGALAEDDASLKAVRDTTGEILIYGGHPALTVYHSNAGGVTESSSTVWSRDYPYLVSVKSPYDGQGAQFLWEFALGAGSLKELLFASGFRMEAPRELYVETRSAAGRVKTLVIKDVDGRGLTLSGEDLRKAVGYSAIRSTLFTVQRSGDIFLFNGRGSGHGVGLSQWGAKGMAEAGYGYKEILEHFYPGTELVKAY